MVEGAEELVIGTKADPRTDVGPLINVAAAERIESWVDEAVEARAAVRTGRKRDGLLLADRADQRAGGVARIDGGSLRPGHRSSHSKRRNVVAGVNRSHYGLQAGIFARDIDAALHVAQDLRVRAAMGFTRIDPRTDGPLMIGVTTTRREVAWPCNCRTDNSPVQREMRARDGLNACACVAFESMPCRRGMRPGRSKGGVPAVDREDRSGDVGRLRRGEEEDGVGDLLGCGEALERDLGLALDGGTPRGRACVGRMLR